MRQAIQQQKCFSPRMHVRVERVTCYTYLYFFPIHCDCFHRKIHSDCVAMAFDEISGLEALHDACFTCPTISNQNNFEQEIKTFFIADRHQRSGIANGHLRQVSSKPYVQQYIDFTIPRRFSLFSITFYDEYLAIPSTKLK